MIAFLFSFTQFLAPGILFPALATFRPMLSITMIGLMRALSYGDNPVAKQAFAHPSFRYLMAFIFVQVVSVYYGGSHALLNEFDYWFTYIGFLIVGVMLVNSIAKLNAFLWGMMLSGAFVIFYGIHGAVYGTSTLFGGKAGAYGMYANHNDYTFLIVMVLPFIFVYRRMSNGWLRRMGMTVMLAACAVGVLLSLSRGGILALVLECLLIVMFFVKQGKRAMPVFLLIVIGGVGVTYQFAKRAEVQGEGYTAEDSREGRLELWKAGWRMFVDHPILGVGSRRFEEYKFDYGDISREHWDLNSHNTYVEIVSGSGLAGLLTFLGFSVSLIRALRRENFLDEHPVLEHARLATLIALYSMLFRAFFDAKMHEWGIYTLCIIGVCVLALGKTMQDERDVSALRTGAA